MIGERLLGMISGEDPRLALMRGLMGAGTPQPAAGTPATPGPDGGTPAPVAQGDGTVAPAPAGAPAGAPPQPRAYQSPQDMVALYSAVAERERRANAIDRGLMFIAAAGARPENRGALIGAATSGGAGGSSSSGSGGGGLTSNPLSFIQGVTTLQQQRAAAEQRAARRAALPQLAARYGMPLEAMTQLFDTDKLEGFVADAEKPNRNVQQLADGTFAIVDMGRAGANPRVVSTFGMQTPPTLSPQTTADGRIAPFNPRTGELGTPQGPTTPPTFTPQVVRPGVVAPFNSRTGELGAPQGTPVPQTRTQTDGTGRIVTIDSETGAPVGAPAGEPRPDESQRLLADINKERAAAGRPAMTMEEYLQMNPRSSRTTVNAGDRKEDEIYANVMKTQLERTESSARAIGAIQRGQEQLQRGIVAGSMISPTEVEGRRIISGLFGLPDDSVENTDVYLANMRRLVQEQIKALGSGNGITDRDLRFTEETVGATNAISPASLQRILQIQELQARDQIRKWNEQVERRRTARPDTPWQPIPMPAPSASVLGTIPPAATERLREKVSGSPEERTVAIRDFNARYGSGLAEHILGQ